ncbi:isoprenylcysteine carboxylmethyltransferase family protein [Arthrobacter sp. R1-13]
MATASRTARLRELYENLPLPPGQLTGLAVNLILGRIRPAPLPGSRALHRLGGTGIVVAGVGLNLWALAERRHHSTGAFELERPEVLVTSGPYAITRHPMYVGWWFIHVGAGTLSGSSWVLATFPAAVLAEHLGVLHEEAATAAIFGQSYADYAERVPRYVRFRFRKEG